MVSKANIIGAGPAGLACGIVLQQNGIKCTVYEKEKELGHKVCGEGLTWAGVCCLETLGIHEEMIQAAGARQIVKSRHIFPYEEYDMDHFEERYYTISRQNLLKVMARQFQLHGGKIIVDQYIRRPEQILRNGVICVNAAGCMTQPGKVLLSENLPMGIAAVIYGKSDLCEKIMYFVHRSELSDRYAWCFPLGNNYWNIGVWQTENIQNLYTNYRLFYMEWIEKHFKDVLILKKPQGACLGVFPSTRKEIKSRYFVCGDAAGTCDFYSGEGIPQAMLSGYCTAKKIMNTKEGEAYEEGKSNLIKIHKFSNYV